MEKPAERRSPWRTALLTVPIILAVGFLMGRISNSGYGNDWFDQLSKPALMPAGWVFGAAWSILYVLLGVALALLVSAPTSSKRNMALGLFAAQLILNFTWSPIFFGMHQAAAGLILIIAILVLSIAAAAVIAKVRPAAAWMMVPYVAWLAFATYLNAAIVSLNPGA